MNFLDFHKKLMAVNKGQLITQSIKTNSAKLERLNVQQMEYGLTAKGKRIKPFYFSKDYAKGKRSIGSKAPLGVPDLKVTGAFHRGVKIIIGKAKYYITSRDLKTVDLRRKYGYIFGLSPKSQKTAKRLTTKTFSLLWRQKVGLS
jgi:hypothetical protein